VASRITDKNGRTLFLTMLTSLHGVKKIL